LNIPLKPATLTYGSWLFSQKYPCDIAGGPCMDPAITLNEFEKYKPDYLLYPNIDYSLGYTWAWCPNKCSFCVVPKQNNAKIHNSIWEFHDTRFKKICLLNNNTFSDPQWRETFEEIWEAKLTVRDENGYDLRLLDEEKADALKRTKFDKGLHFSWDLMKDERSIIRGLKIAKNYKLDATFYVLIGYESESITESDIYRCQIIWDYGFYLYPMPYNGGNKAIRDFKRFINLFAYKNYKTIAEGWKNYDPAKRRKR